MAAVKARIDYSQPTSAPGTVNAMSVSNHGTTHPAVAVIGAGTLGVSVTHAALAAGSPTHLVVRPTPGRADRARQQVAASISREVASHRLTETAADRMLKSLTVVSDLDVVASAEVVIESIHEDLADKRALLHDIEAVAASQCPILSTTSTIAASELGVGAQRPSRIAVAHYIWPAHRIPVVEVSLPVGVDSHTVAMLDRLLVAQGKKQLRVLDRPGFFLTRALFAYWNETVALIQAGLAADVIDRELERFGWPIGPCRLMDATTLVSVVNI